MFGDFATTPPPNTPAPTPTPAPAAGGKPTFVRKPITKLHPYIAWGDAGDKLSEYVQGNPLVSQNVGKFLEAIKATDNPYHLRTTVMAGSLEFLPKEKTDIGIPWRDYTSRDGADFKKYNPVQMSDFSIDIATLVDPAGIKEGDSAGVLKIKNNHVYSAYGYRHERAAYAVVILLHGESIQGSGTDNLNWKTGGEAFRLARLCKSPLVKIPVFNLSSTVDTDKIIQLMSE